MTPRWGGPSKYLTFPKVTLHDHLDGSLLPETMIELAHQQGVRLPYDDAETLAWWFHTRDAEPREEFPHQKFAFTTSLMQDAASIARVAREWVLEVAADGVLYGEVRWAPEKHLVGGLTADEAVLAVADGLREGEAAAAAQGYDVVARQLLCGMRETDMVGEIAELAIAHLGSSVVGFDIAGPEEGHRVGRHVAAYRRLHEAGVPITIHAGEGDGVGSVWETIHLGHPQRIGHGVRVIEDVELNGTPLEVATAVSAVAAARAEGRAELTLGPVARWVLDRRIPLEVCLSSNSRWVVPGRENHPIALLAELGFAVTINPDNRMMSQTCISAEMNHLADVFGWGHGQFLTTQLAAARAAFLPRADQLRLADRIVELAG